MQKQLQELTLRAFPAADPQTQEKMLVESFKLWEQFAANYSATIFQAMEQTLQRSQEIQSQVGDAFTKTFELWLPPAFRGTVTPRQDAAPASEPGIPSELVKHLETLTAQVQALSAKIEKLEKSQK